MTTGEPRRHFGEVGGGRCGGDQPRRHERTLAPAPDAAGTEETRDVQYEYTDNTKPCVMLFNPG